MAALLFGALFFGLAAYAGTLLAETFSATPFADGPVPAEPPVPWIVTGAALMGTVLSTHTGGRELALQAIVIGALAAVWCTDMRLGIVPDVFTLFPLGLVLVTALFERNAGPPLSAIVAFAPFALMAAISKGRGMGWGDVKLAALGGAVLGMETALLAFAGGCILAVLHAYVTRRSRRAIAFAPYLAGAIALALPLAPS